MRRRIGAVAVVSLLLLSATACSTAAAPTTTTATATAEATTETKSSAPLLNETLTLTLNASIRSADSSGISDADYDKYNAIMAYLNKYPNKSEASLFAELAKTYGGTAEALQKFMNDNMIKAIQRDQGGGASIPKAEIQRLSEAFLQANINAQGQPVTAGDADITITGQRAVSAISFKRGSDTHEAIIKFELDSETKTARVYQLKIDGKNIDSVTD